MGQSKRQNNQISEQHGHREGQNPSDIDQDRGNFEPGSNKPGGDGKKTTDRESKDPRPSKGQKPNSPQPDQPGGADRSKAAVLDPDSPASKPYGTTNDQVNTMEGEGQAQQPGQEPPRDIHDESVKKTEDKMTDPDYKAVKRQIDKANSDRRQRDNKHGRR